MIHAWASEDNLRESVVSYLWVSAFELRSSVLALLSAEHLTSPGGFKLSLSVRFQTKKGTEEKEAWVWLPEGRVIENKI